MTFPYACRYSPGRTATSTEVIAFAEQHAASMRYQAVHDTQTWFGEVPEPAFVFYLPLQILKPSAC
jgi:hypothetical protein